MQELNAYELEAVVGGRGKWDWWCGVFVGVAVAGAVSGNVLVAGLATNKAIAVCGVALGGYAT